MYIKKIIASVALVATVAVSAAMFAAFEAHVINVTAKIENALSVMPDEIMFGTVFPQEQLERNLNIALSSSFLEEDRVDDVDYVIKQKPKPRHDIEFVLVYNYEIPDEIIAHKYCLEYSAGDPGQGPTGELLNYYDYCYYNLCPYLSKHPDGVPECGNDGSLDAFHPTNAVVNGRLAKSEQDFSDEWVIDLKTPCFLGMCDQDADNPKNLYDDEIPGFYVPVEYRLPAGQESEMFGCDLWVEVVGVSVNYIDRVDFGDVDSEGWHLDMVGDDWSYTQADLPFTGSNYGGGDDGTFRLVMGPPTGCDSEHLYATFRMDVGMDTGTKTLVLRHLDGSQTDDFEVFVKEDDGTWTLIGTYNHSGNTSETWMTSKFDFDNKTSITEFKIVAIEPATTWCETWGQVAFSWAEVK